MVVLSGGKRFFGSHATFCSVVEPIFLFFLDSLPNASKIWKSFCGYSPLVPQNAVGTSDKKDEGI